MYLAAAKRSSFQNLAQGFVVCKGLELNRWPLCDCISYVDLPIVALLLALARMWAVVTLLKQQGAFKQLTFQTNAVTNLLQDSMINMFVVFLPQLG